MFWDGYDQGQPNSVDDAAVLSAYGTMGQGGNVWEWNETAIGSSRGLRGGYWSYTSVKLRASNRGDNNPANELDSIGFRVASSEAVSEPGSIAMLLGMGLTGLVLRRRRR